MAWDALRPGALEVTQASWCSHLGIVDSPEDLRSLCEKVSKQAPVISDGVWWVTAHTVASDAGMRVPPVCLPEQLEAAALWGDPK